jgi:hypothetical protein
LACYFGLPSHAETVPLAQLLADASGSGTYRPASQHERQESTRLFAETCRDHPDFDQLAAAWRKLDFDLLRFHHEGRQVLLVRESARHRHGRGFYAFCPHASRSIVLQAPHSMYDQHTGRICADLFLDGDILAAGWNTLHRSHVDVAHTPDTVFGSFTEGVARGRGGSLFVQVHGFTTSKRTTRAAARADLIVSNGTRHPDAWCQAAVTNLRIWLPGSQTSLFPTEVNELGGTSNVQAAILHRSPEASFLHLEISQTLRRTLRSDTKIRQQFCKALIETYDTVH